MLQRHQVGSMSTVFVVELASHQRAAVFPLQALHLGEYLTIETLDERQKDRIFGTSPASFLKHPIGNAAIARLSMAERTYAKHYRQSFGLAHLNETTKIALSAPVKNTFIFLDMIPEHVSGDDGHASLLHFPHLVSPFIGRDTRIMNLAHHRAHSLAINQQTLLIPTHFGDIGHH